MTGDTPEQFAPVAPEFFVRDVDASIAYYTGVCGFTLIRSDRDPDGKASFAVLALGRAEFMFADERFLGTETRAALTHPRAPGLDIRLMVSDVRAVYDRVRERGAKIQLPLKDQPYGLRDFTIKDPDGYRIRFAERIDGAH
jgi:catechol 2,3-dioxygenase-like lactoylglutathione lyase family enzyme